MPDVAVWQRQFAALARDDSPRRRFHEFPKVRSRTGVLEPRRPLVLPDQELSTTDRPSPTVLRVVDGDRGIAIGEREQLGNFHRQRVSEGFEEVKFGTGDDLHCRGI